MVGKGPCARDLSPATVPGTTGSPTERRKEHQAWTTEPGEGLTTARAGAATGTPHQRDGAPTNRTTDTPDTHATTETGQSGSPISTRWTRIGMSWRGAEGDSTSTRCNYLLRLTTRGRQPRPSPAVGQDTVPDGVAPVTERVPDRSTQDYRRIAAGPAALRGGGHQIQEGYSVQRTPDTGNADSNNHYRSNKRRAAGLTGRALHVTGAQDYGNAQTRQHYKRRRHRRTPQSLSFFSYCITRAEIHSSQREPQPGRSR